MPMQVGALLLLLTSLAHYRCGLPVPKLSGMAIESMLISKCSLFHLWSPVQPFLNSDFEIGSSKLCSVTLKQI